MKRTFSVAIEGQKDDSKAVKNKYVKIEENLHKPLMMRPGVINQSFKISVPSQRNPAKHHVVTMKDGLQFECDCGDEWNVQPRRNHCAHIGMVIGNMLKDYIKNTLGKDADKISEVDMNAFLKEFSKTMCIL